MFAGPIVSRNASAAVRRVRVDAVRSRVTFAAIGSLVSGLPRITGSLRVGAAVGPPQVASHATAGVVLYSKTSYVSGEVANVLGGVQMTALPTESVVRSEARSAANSGRILVEGRYSASR